jgi:hypothetical protein
MGNEKNAPESKLERNELKSSRDEKTSGRKKDEMVDRLITDQGFAKDKGMIEGSVIVPESTFAAITDTIQPSVSSETSSDLVAGQNINKEELNFRQVQLSPKEQKVVNELKNQVQNSERPAKYQK